MIGHQRQRDPRTRFDVGRNKGPEIEIRQRVAVDYQKRLGLEERQSQAGAAGTPEHLPRLPRVADPRPEILAVADHGGERFGAMVQVQHQLGRAPGDQPADDAPNHRIAGNRYRRLRAYIAERAKTGAMSSGQNHGLTNHGLLSVLRAYSSSNSIIPLVRTPRRSQSCVYKRRYESSR